MNRPAIYFRMPRVASATLARLSEGRCVILPHDLSPREVRAVLDANRSKFRWTFVRHPYSRFASAWEWSQREFRPRQYPLDVQQRSALKQFDGMESVANNLGGICSDHEAMPIHFYPQSSYLYFKRRCCVDFIGRYERLEPDFLRVAKMLGMRRRAHFGPNAKNPLRQELTMPDLPVNVRRALDEFYAEDFERFGYEPH